jgi:hypothetical protein
MRAWHIFAVGTLVLIAALFLPLYHALLAAFGAVAIVGVVAFGFLLRPRREVLYLKTSTPRQHDGVPAIEHGRVAIRIELTRLWLLFIPTFLAVAFLIAIWARNSTLKLDLFDVIFPHIGTGIAFARVGEIIVLIVVGILSVWISERSLLRDAAACSARSVWIGNGRLSYSFLDDRGEFYGGQTLAISKYSAQLANIVVYNVKRPDLNEIAIGLRFHRLVIIGHGLTELDQQTVQARLPLIQPTT